MKKLLFLVAMISAMNVTAQKGLDLVEYNNIQEKLDDGQIASGFTIGPQKTVKTSSVTFKVGKLLRSKDNSPVGVVLTHSSNTGNLMYLVPSTESDLNVGTKALTDFLSDFDAPLKGQDKDFVFLLWWTITESI